MQRHFIALAYDEADGPVGVVFPDLPGCVAEADTLDDALTVAAEVLAFHLDTARADGEDLPEPRSFAQLKNERSAGDDWWDWENAIVAAVAPRLPMEAAE